MQPPGSSGERSAHSGTDAGVEREDGRRAERGAGAGGVRSDSDVECRDSDADGARDSDVDGVRDGDVDGAHDRTSDEASADRTRSPTIGFYHPRAGIQTGGGKSVYVRGMLRQLAGHHDVVLYTGEGRLLESVRELPIDVVQVPTDRVADVDVPGALASVLPANAAETLAERATDSLVETATATLAESRVSETLVPSASARTSLLGFANARGQGRCEEMSRCLDVLYTQYFLDDVLFSRSVDVPTVYHCHGLDGRGVGEHVRSRLSATEYTLANTGRMADELSRRFDVEPDGVVAPGVDVDRFAPDATPAFESAAPVVLFVGRVERSKGVFDLVDAVAGLSADAVCHVVGDGPHESELRSHVAERGIEASVQFHGVVPNEALHGFYAAADVVCNPSHYESLGIANLEAMACGRPLVAARLDAIEEYVTDGESGLLVPPGDAEALRRTLDRVLASPALRDRLGRAGREVASEYSWDEQARTLTELLEVAAADEREPREREPRERGARRASGGPGATGATAHSGASGPTRRRTDRR